MQLSDAFIHGNSQSKMELQVQILNINYGHNKSLMERCPTLMQYAILVSKIKTYRKNMIFEDAILRAIDECIEENVLRKFLMTRRAEIMNSLLTEYDEEQVLADIGQEYYEDGLKEGKELGEALGKAEAIIELLGESGNVPDDLKTAILQETDLTVLKKWFTLAIKAGSVEAFRNQAQL